MINPESELNPLTKLAIYSEARKIMLQKMDNEIVSPDKADQVLDYVETKLSGIHNPDEATEFCKVLSKKFPELEEMEIKFHNKTMEKIDKVLINIVDIIMDSGDFELASKLMHEIDEISKTEDDQKQLDYIVKISKKFPLEYGAAKYRTN